MKSLVCAQFVHEESNARLLNLLQPKGDRTQVNAAALKLWAGLHFLVFTAAVRYNITRVWTATVTGRAVLLMTGFGSPAGSDTLAYRRLTAQNACPLRSLAVAVSIDGF